MAETLKFVHVLIKIVHLWKKIRVRVDVVKAIVYMA
ncbi:Nodule Cysteine-Rich (NCR) secreted peptide [Medicago truncatula]|uniref:Nodule Cysteine-Rich (NCR) secreted peptide n=1 Tax=Medicago truncatula TaxID=3880 RepID=A0A072UIG4_MEDTR|nr:Nodule Cysteine-Rich (NCR) secreted peptide [Medicago truncatula]